MQKNIVITTINPKSKAIDRFSELLPAWHITLIGDKKSIHINDEKNIHFLSVDEQKQLPYETITATPFNHYSRKNIGYLFAMETGAETIYDTDDDNIPYPDWSDLAFEHTTYTESTSDYLNVYKLFSDEHIWPRGYPLDEIKVDADIKTHTSPIKIGAWQGLADEDPDVDAIYRLVMGKEITFKKSEPVVLGKKLYCPFNSQNTLWHKSSFPLLYLPSTVSFRFTDILRGYIAQRLFWEQDRHLGFTKATVYQERNEHNLMKDFTDEITCYTEVKKVVDILNNLELGANHSKSLEKVYAALLEHNIVQKAEMERLYALLRDVEKYATAI